MMYSLSSPPLVVMMVAFVAQGVVAQYPAGKTFKPGYCNVCRDAPNKDVAWRNLANPGESFTMNGEKWTCGYLQDTVQDVNPYAGGAPGEARWCGLAQHFAEQHCSCNGPSIPSLNDNVQQLNPACDLCQGQALNYVPQVNAGLTANTGVAGNMNCKGLYNAMSQGVLTSNLCPQVIANAGPKCCGVEKFTPNEFQNPDVVNQNNNVPQAPTCVSAAEVCKYNSDCCPGLQCKVKVWNGDKYCSTTSSRRGRKSIAGNNVGGAAGRSRSGGR